VPSDLHLVTVKRLVEAGLPTLCEKPVGVTSAESREAAAAVAAAGLPFQVGFWRRFVPALQRLRERIATGELGQIYCVANFQWDGAPPGPEFRAHSGGIFIDMGVHEFDQIRWLSGQEFGDLDAVSSPVGEAGDIGDDVDSAQALGTLSGGTSAFVSLGRFFPGGDMARIEVFGTADAVRCDFLDPKDGDRAQLEALVRQAEGFAAFARGGARTGASIRDAAAALAAAERAASAIALVPAAAGPRS